MSTLNELMQRIRAQKKEKKELGGMFRDGLAQSQAYQKVNDELKELKAKKKRFEAEIRQEFSGELEKMEKLSQSLKADLQLLSDMALTKFMKGETIEVTDENDTKYEPVIKIGFKKQG